MQVTIADHYSHRKQLTTYLVSQSKVCTVLEQEVHQSHRAHLRGVEHGGAAVLRPGVHRHTLSQQQVSDVAVLVRHRQVQGREPILKGSGKSAVTKSAAEV
jgi:hypothetical protein